MHQTTDMAGTQIYPTATVLPFDRSAPADSQAPDQAPAALPRRAENPKLVKTCNLVIQAIIALPFLLAFVAILRRFF